MKSGSGSLSAPLPVGERRRQSSPSQPVHPEQTRSDAPPRFVWAEYVEKPHDEL